MLLLKVGVTSFGWSQSISASGKRRSQHPSQSGMQMLPPRGLCSHAHAGACFATSVLCETSVLSLGQFGRPHLSEGTSQLSDYGLWAESMCPPPFLAMLLPRERRS